jgi:hypothetical protein
MAGADTSAAVCEFKVPCWGLPVHLAIAAYKTVKQVDQAVERHGSREMAKRSTPGKPVVAL